MLRGKDLDGAAPSPPFLHQGEGPTRVAWGGGFNNIRKSENPKMSGENR